jgi:MoaA/NifB/PqqE/SkfB family radical SAM enzyme
VDTLERLRRTGVRFLILEGGEPFLWHDGHYGLEDIVRAARERFATVGVVTNGTLPLESGADILWASLDGLGESHDRNRGPSFRRILAHIEASAHPNLYVNLTINRLNWQEVPALVQQLAGRVKGITFQFYYPYDGTTDLRLEAGPRRQVLDELVRLKRQGYPVADSVVAMEALKENSWRCHPWLLVNVEPEGKITQGCYLSQRTAIACRSCGFAAHVELSLAYDLVPGAILTGRQVFGLAGR